MTSHATCTHDVTPKARAACRQARADQLRKAEILKARLEGSPQMIRTATRRVNYGMCDQLTLLQCCELLVAAGWNYADVCRVNS